MRGAPKLIELKDKSGALKSPYWYIQYYDGSRGQRTSTGYRIGAQDREAQIFLAEWILERERPTKKPDELMVAQALRDYYEEHAKHIATAKHALYHEKRLKAHFGGHFVSRITPAAINAYVRQCQERKESNGTIRRDLEHLKAALNHEVREQRLIYAPRFKLPPPPAPRERVLSEGEINRLLRACKTPHLKAFVEIMRHTGQRPGAVEKLTWFQVDFKQRIIHFDRTGKAQTNKRARPVAMNNELYRVLAKLHKTKQTEFVLEYEGEHAGTVKKAFERAVKRAKLKDTSRYTLRHTVLDRVNDKADEKTAADIGGHSSVKTTRRNYIKSKMGKQREVLGGLWRKK